MKKFFTKIMKLFYKYDSRYTIVKDEEFKYDKTIVWSVDHSWNSVEWCLPGLYYLKKHYNVNLVFLAADPEIWQRAHEEENMYAILKNICDVIIINRIDPSRCNWLQRKIYRLRKSLLEEESLKYFFGDVKVDVLLEIMNPKTVDEYFKKYHSDTLRIGYEHSIFTEQTTNKEKKKVLVPDVDYFLCTLNSYFDLEDTLNKHKLLVTGAPQLDDWWREFISKKAILELRNRLDSNKKNILVLLPSMLDNERWYKEDKEALIKVLRYFCEKENIVLKFHPREKIETRKAFLQDIFDGNNEKKFTMTTITTECVAKIADCVIVAGATGAAGGAVINDVPVIEFHSNRNISYSFYHENGQCGTMLKVKNVIMSAEDYDSLVATVNGVLYNNAWDMYSGRYKEYINHDNKASQRFAEELIRVMCQ